MCIFYGAALLALGLGALAVPQIWWVLAGLAVLVVPVAFGTGAVMPLAGMLIPGFRCWASPTADITVTAWRTRSGYHAGNFCAWPTGRDISGPFLDELCAQADREQRAIHATAGNRYLYERIYARHGFLIAKNRKRPKIIRHPR